MDLAGLLVRARGVDALSDPEVARALRLTAPQRERMREGRHANAAVRRDCLRKWQESDRTDGIRGLLLIIERQTEEHIRSVLNAL